MLDILKFILNAEEQLTNIKKFINPNVSPIPLIPQGKMMLALMNLLKRSLPQEDYDYLMNHVLSGAPGHLQFLASETIVPLVQMINEEYREFLRGNKK